MAEIKNVKLDRMRYTNNSLSSLFCYIAIALDALYFVSIYSSDVGNYYYTINIGASVVYNLLFLLIAFLCSEGVKNYGKLYGGVVIGIGALQFVRIIGIPLGALTTMVSTGDGNVPAMDIWQFAYVSALLVISGAFCIASGIICILKSRALDNYRREIGVLQ